MATEVEEDVRLEALAVAVAAGLLHEQLDAAVGSLGKGIDNGGHRTPESRDPMAVPEHAVSVLHGRLPVEGDSGGVGERPRRS